MEIFIGDEDVLCDERPTVLVSAAATAGPLTPPYGATSSTNRTHFVSTSAVPEPSPAPVSQNILEKQEIIEDVIVKENVPIFEAKNRNKAVAPLLEQDKCKVVDVKDVELFFIPEIVVQMENELNEEEKQEQECKQKKGISILF